MSAFRYHIQNREGKSVRGILQAGSSKEATRILLDERGARWVYSLRRDWKKEWLQEASVPNSPLPLAQIMVLCHEFSILLDSGVPLFRIFSTLKINFKTRKKFLRIIEVMEEKIREGSTLAAALVSMPKVFSPFFVNMVKMGEETGTLAQIFSKLAAYYNRILSVRRKVRQALTYPAFVICTMFGVFAFGLFFVIPRFQSLYDQLGIKLPGLTQALLDLSRIAVQNRFWLLIFFVTAGLTLPSMVKEKGVLFFQKRWVEKIPVIGNLLRVYQTAIFLRGLWLLVGTGTLFVKAFPLLKETLTLESFRRALDRIEEGIRQGKSLAVLFQEEKILPPLAEQMIVTGEESGKLGAILEKGAAYYEEELDLAVAQASGMMEPALLVIVGIGVAVFMAAMYLPIFKLARGVKI